jgi:eukaryotic-like serine/threonine-protein kinase
VSDLAPDSTLHNSAASPDVEATLDSAVAPEGLPMPDLGSIGPYRLIRKLGEGGMGQVWLAEQSAPVKRQVALKIIAGGRYDGSALMRFDLERQTLAIMDHPAIAKVFDAGSTAEGQPYFVMEYVPGLPINTYCDQKRLTTRERLALFIKVCEGVQHAHQKAIIHRDLKPSNILVVEVDGKPMPRIIDFGIAKAITQQSEDATLVTRVGGMVGTPGYISPEQADPSVLDVDTRTDVYSLGVVLYQLLTGVLPFDVKQWKTKPFHEVLRQLHEEDPVSPSTRISGDETSTAIAEKRSTDARQLANLLRGDLDWITLKALEKDRARRYGTPSEVAADINRYLGNEPVTARPASPAYRLRKYVQRHKFGVAAAAALLLLLVGFGVMQTIELRRITRERDRADRVTQFMTGMFKVSNPSQARGNTITAREILDKSATDIDKGLANDPELQAQMMSVMGDVYKNLGLYPQSESLFTRTLEIRRRTLGPRNPDTLKSAQDLAMLLDGESHYPEAEKLLRETIEIQRRVLGPEHHDTLKSMSNLATVLGDEGHYPESEKLQREQLEIAKRVLDPQDKLIVSGTIRLAIDFAYEGRYSQAEQAFREVLELDRRTHGPDDPAVLNDMSNVAATLEHEERYPEAEKLDLDLLQAKRRVLGPEHPSTLLSMGNLAQILSSEKRYPEAEKLLRDVLEIKRRVLGADHRSTLVTMGNLAEVLMDEGQYPEAEQLERQTLDAERRTLGPDHSDTLVTLSDLSSLLAKEKRYSESEKGYQETFDRERRALGPDHPDTVATAYDLAGVLARDGKRDEAFTNLQYAVEHGLRTEARLGMEKDADLVSLHGDPRFATLVAKAAEGASAKPQ